MACEKSLILVKESFTTIENDKANEETVKKRLSVPTSFEEANLKRSLSVLQESLQSTNFSNPVLYKECFGIDDVIITPTHMEFMDGIEGIPKEQVLTLQNVGKKVAIIKILKPNSMSFEINTIKCGYRLYPGLKLNRVIRYSLKIPSSSRALVPIIINGTTLDYHLINTVTCFRISVEPTVIDMGFVDVGSISGIKKLTIHNIGGKSGRYSIDLGRNDSEINVYPIKGAIKANGKATLAVQIKGKYEGVFHEEFWIKSVPNIRISIILNTIKPKFIVRHPTTTNNFSFLNFPSTFCGTQRYINITFQNASCHATNFVILSEINNNMQTIQEIDVKENPTFDVFRIYPVEGRLQPLEEVILNVIFAPTLKNFLLLQKQRQNKDIDYFVLILRIYKIKLTEAEDILKSQPMSDLDAEIYLKDILNKESDDGTAVSLNGQMQPDTTTLYLHGDVEIPQLQFTPDELYLGDRNIADKLERVVCVKNPSKNLSLHFSFIPKPCIRCEPQRAFLRPEQCIEIIVKINVQFTLESSFKLEFELRAKSMDINELNKSKDLNIARIFIQGSYNPLKAPAKIQVHNKLCKMTSFNKLALEPDYSMTYTLSELEFKMNNREFMNRYFHSIFLNKIGYMDVTNENLSNEEFGTVCNLYKIPKFHDTSFAKKSLQKFIDSSRGDDDEDKFSRTLFPFQIFKICVSPMSLDFGKVGVITVNHKELSFENKNDFPVMISLISLDELSILFPEGNVIVVEPKSALKCLIEFRARYYGKFSFYFNYIINGIHKYQMPIVADVIPKRLELKTKEVIFEKDCLPQEGYRIPFRVIEIENKLNTNIKFKWILPRNSNLMIKPESGTVPSKRRLCVSVYQELDPSKSNRVEAVMLDECGGRGSVKLEAPLRAPKVVLLDGDLDIGELPLNLEHRATAVLYNAEYFGTFFEIEEESLLNGIYVTPMRGAIPPRGIVILNVCLKFNACIEFSTLINIIVQKRLTLKLRLHCSVVFPKIKFKPNKLEMKRVSSNSYRVKEIFATNLTNADATIQFCFKKYPEFCMSFSELKHENSIGDGEILKIPPLATLKLFLHFSPCDLVSYSFCIPMTINEVLGPVTNENISLSSDEFLKTNNKYYLEFPDISILSVTAKLPTISIESTVTYPAICFNKFLFEFNENIRKDELKIFNKSKDIVSFTLITKNLTSTTNCPFTICWFEGVEPTFTNNYISCLLLPYKETKFKIKFNPMQPDVFISELPIFLGDIENGQLYNKLILNGSYPRQSIESDVLEIYLVPTPLNILAKKKFTLKVSNFTEPTCISAKVCCSEMCSRLFQKETLKINFPDGVSINPCCSHEIPVQVQFQSAVPASFCAIAVLSDVKNLTSVSITIYGTADCSLLTIFTYEKKIFRNFSLTKQQSYPLEITSYQPNENLTTKQTVLIDTKAGSLASSTSDASKNKLQMDKFCTIDHKIFNTYKEETISVIDLRTNSSHESTKSPQLFYPFFPTYMNSEKERFMHRILDAVESWLYASVLRYQFNPKLTDGITAAVSEIISPESIPATDKKQNYPKLCTIIDILEYITDSNEISEIDTSLNELEYESNNDRICNALNTYQKILQYLLSKGALVSHISPEFLLNYDDYKELQMDVNYLISEHAFLSRSKQSWLEVILQIYKCFILKQINVNELEKHASLRSGAQSIDCFEHKVQEFKVADVIRLSQNNKRQSKTEAILLAWLECHYNTTFNIRSISDFEDCDALVFIAVTIAYCPFLEEEFFKNIYTNPTSLEQKKHNAICLILAWKKIRIGFIVTPIEIVNPNCIQMLMLTVHLFQVLPTYLIRDKVVFDCPLTKSITRQIKLSIATNYQINYVTQFFGSGNEFFSSKSIVTIHPHKNKHTKVTYQSRKILKTKAYLVLCGSAIGPEFGENRTLLLEGFPNELEIFNEYTIKSKLYHSVRKTLSISLPYEYYTQYEIWLSDERPNLDDLKLTRWADLRLINVPRRLFFIENSLTTLEENIHTADLAMTVSCIAAETRTYWIVFRSEPADFIIQINVRHQPSITSHASIEISEDEYLCEVLSDQNSSECPLDKKIYIPTKNTFMQNCLLQMFKKSFTAEEKLFWANYLDNYIGLRFISWMTKDTDDSITREYKHVFNYSTTYNLTIDKSNILTIRPHSVNIEDVQINDDKVEFDIHISDADPDVLTNAVVTLTSLDKKEIQKCKINFIYEESSTIQQESKSKMNKRQKKKKIKKTLMQ